MKRALLFLALSSLHCAPLAPSTRCPIGTRSDAARHTRIVQLIERAPGAADLVRAESVLLCFGDGFARGVIAGDVAFMDANKSDLELAPRFAHLLSHHRDRIGDGCAKGLAAARDSEVRAAAIESDLRNRLGLPQSASPPTADSDSDYARRCAVDSPSSS